MASCEHLRLRSEFNYLRESGRKTVTKSMIFITAPGFHVSVSAPFTKAYFASTMADSVEVPISDSNLFCSSNLMAIISSLFGSVSIIPATSLSFSRNFIARYLVEYLYLMSGFFCMASFTRSMDCSSSAPWFIWIWRAIEESGFS